MKLDKTKIFTAVNAEQLPIGTMCVLGNCIPQLEEKYNNRVYTVLDGINSDEYLYRFVSKSSEYALAYVVDEHEDVMERFDNLHLGTKLIMKDGYNEDYEFSVIVTGYDRNTLRFYAAGKWYEASELSMFDEVFDEYKS